MDPYTQPMAKKSRLKLMPVDFDKESLGERLARIREVRGLTQKEVARRTGLIQTLVSDYERGRLRLAADMIVRFSVALGITTVNCSSRKSARLPRRGRSAARCSTGWSGSKVCHPISSALCSPPLTASSGLCQN